MWCVLLFGVWFVGVVCWLSWCGVLLDPSVFRFGVFVVWDGCLWCLWWLLFTCCGDGFGLFSGLFLGLGAYLFASCCGCFVFWLLVVLFNSVVLVVSLVW